MGPHLDAPVGPMDVPFPSKPLILVIDYCRVSSYIETGMVCFSEINDFRQICGILGFSSRDPV